MIIRGERSRELIHEWMVGWTWPGWLRTKYRLCDCLKAKCFARIQHAWGQNSSGASCCSYLENTSSTDCAFSYFFDLRPVMCLFFRHRFSFQPFGVASTKSRCFFLSYDRDPKLPVLVQLFGKDDQFVWRGLC